MRPTASFAVLLLGACLGLACPSGDDDDDSTPPVIEPPAGCANFSLSGVTFDFLIHWFGTDYPQAALEELLEQQGATFFAFPFAGEVVELGPAPEAAGKMAITVEELPPEEPEPDWTPNWMRLVYQLPLGYELPVTLGQEVVAQVQMDLGSGQLVHGFALVESADDGGNLLFLAEPSTNGLVYGAGPNHPFFQVVAPVDRACPNLTQFQCAKLYNLALRFQVVAPGPDDPPGETFELWPTETRDFDLAGISFRVVDVYSYTHREINEECTGFDWSADRMSYFVTRTSAAPAD